MATPVTGGGRARVVEEGEGDVMEANPPPPDRSSQTTLPKWLLKVLGPTSAAAHKAAMVPWSAHALQEAWARDQPLFSGASDAHMTLEWVYCRLVLCTIRRGGKNKGTWRRDSEGRGASTWRHLPCEPLSRVPEGISVEVLTRLKK